MPRRIAAIDAPVRFTFEGSEVTAAAGESVAAALLAAGHRHFGFTATSGAPRGPYCLMGACFDCMVEIDGSSHRQACMIEARPGMAVRRMAPLPTSEEEFR